MFTTKTAYFVYLSKGKLKANLTRCTLVKVMHGRETNEDIRPKVVQSSL